MRARPPFASPVRRGAQALLAGRGAAMRGRVVCVGLSGRFTRTYSISPTSTRARATGTTTARQPSSRSTVRALQKGRVPLMELSASPKEL